MFNIKKKLIILKPKIYQKYTEKIYSLFYNKVCLGNFPLLYIYTHNQQKKVIWYTLRKESRAFSRKTYSSLNKVNIFLNATGCIFVQNLKILRKPIYKVKNKNTLLKYELN